LFWERPGKKSNGAATPGVYLPNQTLGKPQNCDRGGGKQNRSASDTQTGSCYILKPRFKKAQATLFTGRRGETADGTAIGTLSHESPLQGPTVGPLNGFNCPVGVVVARRISLIT
jgi:hypothetical protein